MNKQNSKDFDVLLEAAELLTPEPRKQILEKLAEIENAPDETISRTVESIRTTLAELGIIT